MKIQSLNDILKNNAKSNALETALSMKWGFRFINFNYKELYDQARQVAQLLESMGIGKGDHIIIIAPNSPYWVITFWACLLEGIILVPLNIQSNLEIVKLIVDQVKPKLIVTKNFNLEEIKEKNKIISTEDLINKAAKLKAKDHQEKLIKPNDIVEIMYTSGTTGAPKGVILTHKNIVSNVNSIIKQFPDYKDNKSFLSILPLSHIFEQTGGLFAPQVIGAHIIFAHRPTAITELIKEFEISTMAAVPEFLHVVMGKIKTAIKKKKLSWILSLLRKIREKNPGNVKLLRAISYPIRKQLGTSLKTIISGGAALDAETESEWSDLGINILQGYGLTETSPVIATNTYLNRKEGSVGKPLPDVKIKIEDGEIFVKGPNVFQGYYKNPKATAEAFSKGWFKTGDIGEIDQDGYLFIKGRKKYMILSPSGQNVYPEDLEAAIRKQQGVKDAAVAGIEKNKNVTIFAFIILQKNSKINIKEIIKNANHELASYQQIMDYAVWPEEDFPRTATRKVKKNELIDFLAKKTDKKNKVQQSSKLVQIISSVSHIAANEISAKTTMKSLHIDSLKRAELTARIINEYAIQFNEQKIKSETTVKELEAIIAKSPAIKPAKTVNKYLQWLPVRLIRVIIIELFCLAVRLFVKLKVKNKNYLKLNEPSILMPNHVSYMDPVLILLSLPYHQRTKIAFAAAQDALFKKHPWLSKITTFVIYTFPISRHAESNIEEAFTFMGKLLDDGYSIVFFPEGQISKNEKQILPLKNGAGLASVYLNAPIIPITINGAQAVQPYDKIIPVKRGEVVINVGQPIKFASTDDVSAATNIIENTLKSLKID
jgi:long-chain acyl-CoA synthetase